MKRLIVALGLSVLFNSAMISVGFFVDPAEFPLTRIGQIMNTLGRPGGVVTEWLLPGHSFPQVLLTILSSVLFYTFMIWFIISLPVWWQNRS